MSVPSFTTLELSLRMDRAGSTVEKLRKGERLMSNVVRLVSGVSGDGLAVPFEYATLDCGHSATSVREARWMECAKCHSRVHRVDGEPWPHCCGAGFYSRERDPVRLLNVGDAVDCAECGQFAIALDTLRELVARGELAHTRCRRWCGVELIHCYRRDTASPTGVKLAHSIEARPEAFALLRGGLSPLSPTEGL